MTHLIVKQRTFWQTPMGLFVRFLVVLFFVWVAFEMGRYWAGYTLLTTDEVLASQQQQLLELEQERRDLLQQRAVLERSNEIELQARDQVKDSVNGLQEEVAELKEELAFYRGIVSPDNGDKGLRLQEFTLLSTTEPNRYRFKAVLTQVLNNGSVVRGNLSLSVDGAESGAEKTYTLNELDGNVPKNGLAFKFKYFQVLDGELLLPEGFQPRQLQISVKPRSRIHKAFDQTVVWAVEESK